MEFKVIQHMNIAIRLGSLHSYCIWEQDDRAYTAIKSRQLTEHDLHMGVGGGGGPQWNAWVSAKFTHIWFDFNRHANNQHTIEIIPFMGISMLRHYSQSDYLGQKHPNHAVNQLKPTGKQHTSLCYCKLAFPPSTPPSRQ